MQHACNLHAGHRQMIQCVYTYICMLHAACSRHACNLLVKYASCERSITCQCRGMTVDSSFQVRTLWYNRQRACRPTCQVRGCHQGWPTASVQCGYSNETADQGHSTHSWKNQECTRPVQWAKGQCHRAGTTSLRSQQPTTGIETCQQAHSPFLSVNYGYLCCYRQNCCLPLLIWYIPRLL